MANNSHQFALALEHQRQGNLRRAGALYRRILKRDPAHADALYRLGLVLFATGNPKAALVLIGKAVELRGPVAEYCAGMGRILLANGSALEAAACFRQALRSSPLDAEIARELGSALASAGDRRDAALAFEHASELNPSDAPTQYDLGVARIRLRNWQDAVRPLERAIQLRPGYAAAHSNLAIALHELGDSRAAAEHCRSAMRLKPDCAKARYNLGRALQSQGEFELALAEYSQVLDRVPEHIEARTNAGNILAAMRRFDQALHHYRTALEWSPGQPETHWNLGLTLLQLGRLDEAWPHYEYRFSQPGFEVRREFGRPLWDGAPLAGKRILLHAEQGLGDTIQFVRYIPLVEDRGGRVILEVQPSLVRLLAGAGPAEVVVGRGDPLPDFDVHAPLMSLPGIFRTNLDSIPGGVPYLHADPCLVEDWRVCTRRFQVGLVWAGNPAHSNDRNRSLAAGALTGVGEGCAADFFSLQKGKRERPAIPGLVCVGDAFQDFADTAAVVSQMDLVISADTSVAHLAGAMGLPAWVLLPHGADWRWMLDRPDSPWYPTMRLFRQNRPGEWGPVIAAVNGELARLTG